MFTGREAHQIRVDQNRENLLPEFDTVLPSYRHEEFLTLLPSVTVSGILKTSRATGAAPGGAGLRHQRHNAPPRRLVPERVLHTRPRGCAIYRPWTTSTCHTNTSHPFAQTPTEKESRSFSSGSLRNRRFQRSCSTPKTGPWRLPEPCSMPHCNFQTNNPTKRHGWRLDQN